jgi:HAD superfamily hydrolase (TIGR01490 family)
LSDDLNTAEVYGRSAAFFDLDKTLIEGSSAFHFARAAYRAGLMSRAQLVRDLLANLRFRVQGSTDAGTAQLRERVQGTLKGMRVIDLDRLAPEVLAGVLPGVYRQVLDTAYAHQDMGRRVYIVTAGSQNIAELLAHVLLLDGGIGTRYEVKDGVYTGRITGPFTYREGKAEAVFEVAAREGLDLQACYAYSDSESDLPLLRCVGHPVAVNPDAQLERIARDEDWQVMRFDRLGRQLRLGSSVAAVALLGGGGGYWVARRNRRRGGIIFNPRRRLPGRGNRMPLK